MAGRRLFVKATDFTVEMGIAGLPITDIVDRMLVSKTVIVRVRVEKDGREYGPYTIENDETEVKDVPTS